MDIGALPGYYFDTEKKKYFKIQPNHIAPSNAKYSRSNVILEKQDAKKRKVEDEHQELVRRQTVSAARPLDHALVGATGIRREIGSTPASNIHRDTAVVHGLVSDPISLEIHGYPGAATSIVDAHPLNLCSQMLLNVSHHAGSHCIYIYDSLPYNTQGKLHNLPTKRPVHAFHDQMTLLRPSTVRGTSLIIALTGRHNPATGDVFIGRLPDSSFEDDNTPSGTSYHIATADETIWDCKSDCHSGRIAFTGSQDASVFNLDSMKAINRLVFGSNMEAFACDWLNPNILAFGARQSHKKSADHNAFLWDIRTSGVASRFIRGERITAVHNPNDSGTNLLVSGNRDVSLYDLRVLQRDRPLVSIAHTSGTTRLQLATYKDLLVAVDVRFKAQVYSLRTGNNIRTFSGGRGLLRNPRWQEDSRGALFLQACVANTIQRWV